MNQLQLIKDLIKQGESENLEFKDNVRQRDSIARNVCGFLNGEGGQILIGVTVDGQISGVNNAARIAENLRAYLIENIIPEFALEVSSEKMGDAEIITVRVWRGSKKPYIFNGGIFFRRGANTVAATSQEISGLIHRRQEAENHWERQPVVNAELEDLDVEEIQSSINEAANRSDKIKPGSGAADFLSYYGLLQNGRLTNAAVVLFARRPAEFLPQCRVRLSILRRGKTSVELTNDRLLDGNLFKNLRAIDEYLNLYVGQTSKLFETMWQRRDEREYPLSALREAVLNALIHRDYANISGTVSILLYPDKLEIINSGELPFKPNESNRNQLSFLVNPDIAQIVYLRGFIEKMGIGIPFIVESCRRAGLKTPVWSTDSHSVKLTFFSNTKLREMDAATIEGTVEAIIEGAVKGTTTSVKSKLKKLLLAVSENEGGKAKDYAAVTKIAAKSIERYLKILSDVELIEFKGTAKQTGGYFATEKVKPPR